MIVAPCHGRSDTRKALTRSERGLLLLAGLVLACAFFHTAWVSDDAFISFRVVRNFIEGRGLTWNLGERVQVFTHPLWLLSLAAVSALTREQYFASLLLSAGCVAVSAWFVTRTAHNAYAAALALAVLSLSRVFIDYSSSGLENPLSHALIAALFWRLGKLGPAPRWRETTLGFLLAALLVANRMDMVLIAAPMALALAWRARTLGPLRLSTAMLVGGIPLLAWLAFATFYFGSPFPNTYFAKLATGLPASELVPQGLAYVESLFSLDWVSGATIVAALVVSVFNRACRVAGLGLIAYVAYVVSIGGDFMAGRFFSAPLLLSVLILLTAARHIPRFRRPLALLSTAFLINIPTTVLSSPTYSNWVISERGIADERGYYNVTSGLQRNLGSPLRETHPFAQMGFAAGQSGGTLFETCYVGMTGYYAPREAHFVDGYGLTDPLLARLPALKPWRIGHFERPSPPGYLDMLAGKATSIADPQLDLLWRDLYLAHRADMNAPGRLAAIARLNTGHWKSLVASSAFVAEATAVAKPSRWHCRGRPGQSLNMIEVVSRAQSE